MGGAVLPGLGLSPFAFQQGGSHSVETVADGKESSSVCWALGRSCCSSWREEPWEPLGGWKSEPRLSISVSFLSGPQPTPTPPRCLGFPPRARAVQPVCQADWRGLVPAKMTPSQQWKEEPISQQCRGWGWRVGVVHRPIVCAR